MCLSCGLTVHLFSLPPPKKNSSCICSACQWMLKGNKLWVHSFVQFVCHSSPRALKHSRFNQFENCLNKRLKHNKSRRKTPTNLCCLAQQLSIVFWDMRLSASCNTGRKGKNKTAAICFIV